MSLTELAEKVKRVRFEFDTATRRLQEERLAHGELAIRLDDTKEAQVVTQKVAKEIQDRTYGCIASIVTQCLEAVFEEPYKFRLDFESKRGQSEARLSFERDGELVDPVAASGGGVVDVAAFALRLAALVLLGSRARRVLILDEPFKFLSAEYRERIRDLLLLLSEKLHLQIIMVTHIDELKVGRIVVLR